jgi:hypothetical protein
MLARGTTVGSASRGAEPLLRQIPLARERHSAHAEKFSYGQAASENSGMGAEAERAPNIAHKQFRDVELLCCG